MNYSAKTKICVVVATTCLMRPAIASGAPAAIRYRGTPAELAIHKISERTLQVVLSPLDEATGKPQPAPPSNVFVEHRPQKEVHRRSFEGSESFSFGKLSVEVHPNPLSISIRRPDGDLVQTLTFDTDIDSTWRTLAAQVSVGLNHSLSLSPYWGTDIGGFYPTRELTGKFYVRWFQFGTFCPSFRAHGRTWHQVSF